MPLTYTRELSDDDVVALQHLVPNVTEWIDTAISEKIAACKKRMVREYIDKAIENNLALPSTPAEIIQVVVSDKNYQTQKQRDDAGVTPVEITPIITPVITPPITPVITPETETNGQPA